MAFYGYGNDNYQCYSTPYSNYGESESIQYNSSTLYANDFYDYSLHAYSEPKKMQYDPIEYHASHDYYEYSVNSSEMNHEFYNYYQPKLLKYEPPPYISGYFPSQTKFTISYSKVEFNEPEFEEYDPTPYDGGYDPATTYGKPLPPSDIICYPRSVPQFDSMALANFSYGSVPSPYGQDGDFPSKPLNVTKPTNRKTEEENRVGNGGKVSSIGEIVGPLDVILGDDSQSFEDENEFGNGNGGDYGQKEDDRRVINQIPYGSGLESMDLCESIFGYWPCLAKIEQQQQRDKCCEMRDQERRDDPWKIAADYLFGNPSVSSCENYHQSWA